MLFRSAIADAPPGGILFHCYAGKDRTGIIAAALLSLAGVDGDDITADYMLTQTYLRAILQKLEDEGTDPVYTYMHPTIMLEFLDHFNKKFGGLASYLETLPLPAGTLETIRRRLI